MNANVVMPKWIVAILSVVMIGAVHASAREWSQDLLEANLYPSAESAARSAVRSFVRDVVLLKQKENPSRIQFVVNEETRSGIGTILISSAKKELSGTRVELIADSASPATASDTVVTTVQWRTADREQPGQVAILLRDNPSEFRSASYVDKHWVEEAQLNDAGRWLVIRPESMTSSESQASQDALQKAAHALAPAIAARSGIHGNHDAVARFVHEKLADLDTRRTLVADEFVQRFDRPYGTVYRKAMMLDTSADTIETLALQYRHRAHGERRQERLQIVSSLGVIAVVFLLYVLVNAVTRGYFRWKLRALAVITILAMIAAITALLA